MKELNPNEINILCCGYDTENNLFNNLKKTFGANSLFEEIEIYPKFNNVDLNLLIKKEGDEKHYFYPMTEREYTEFLNNVIKFSSPLIDEGFILKPNAFEELVIRDKDSLKNHSFMPIYLKTSFRPYAVLKFTKTDDGLRLNYLGSNLPFEVQQKIFQTIAPLKKAVLLRKSEMKKATFLNSRFMINEFNQSCIDEKIFFAGSILGIDGFFDSLASGLLTAINVNKYASGKQMIP